MTQSHRIGLAGIGMMGHGIARNLLAKGYPLALKAHRRREALADLLAAGAREVDSAAALARECDIVIVCVTGSPQVEELVRGRGGLFEGARPGLRIVDCSTA